MAGRAMADGPKSPWKKAFMLGSSVSKGPVLGHFQLLKEAGFAGVELLSPNGSTSTRCLKARDETGLIIHGISGSEHWSSPLSSPDPEGGRERASTRSASRSPTARRTAGTTVLLVPAVVNAKVSYREAYARSQANIRKILPEAEAAGIKIAIEEVWNKFLLSAPEMAKYIDEFGTPAVGAYFDVGNVVEYGFPQEWIKELGKRILKIHVKEYGKAKRFGYPLGEGRDRLGGRPSGPDRDRLRRLDHRRGRPGRPGGDEGRGRADGQDPRAWVESRGLRPTGEKFGSPS